VQPSSSRNSNSQQKLQLATHAIHNRAAACAVASGGILENLLRAQVIVN